MTIGFSHGSDRASSTRCWRASPTRVYLVGAARRGALRQPGRGGAARLRRRGRAARPPEPRDDPLAPARRQRRSPSRSARCCGRARRARRCAWSSTGSSAATAPFVPVGYASAPMETPDGRGAVVVFRDVTRAARGRGGRRLAGADRRRHRRRAAPDRPRPARRRAAAARAGADGDRGGAARPGAGAGRAGARPRPTPVARSTTCASWPTACTRSCSPTAGSRVALEELTAGAPVAGRAATSPRSASRPTIEAAAYFFVAEALTNAVKHARRERRRRDDRARRRRRCASRSPTTAAAAPTPRAAPACAGCRTGSRCSAGRFELDLGARRDDAAGVRLPLAAA